ncbi:membrane bound cation transporter [Phyllosticta citrichinensis]|uniref:Membrane bound cation transporter n=1 Tax=Phyllosticta citrichinensis TaxID=1130410 RepID=A0ABR1XWB1_9PEZI
MHRINSWAHAHASNRTQRPDRRPPQPLRSTPSNGTNPSSKSPASQSDPNAEKDPPNSNSTSRQPPDNTQLDGAPPAAVEDNPKLPPLTRAKNGTFRFVHHFIDALCYSWVNVLLVFVPIGIATKPAHMSEELVFSMNAIAIIPLAGLLSHATESVASRLGDTLGALLNVSFGNAVELILFIILLAKDQIRVVQASLLGSILANLLLILGMAFLLGGLRFQEQVYNNTVTNMSACLLSLAVMSLLLPTAFHASFSNEANADVKTLKVSRGTSVVLLVVYVLYLLFQLKSHSYLYESTPQHIIDEESHPGVLADMLNSSSSDSSSSSSDSSDTDTSSGSNTTAKRIKRAFRHRKRRKSSASSRTSPSMPSAASVITSPSVENHRAYFDSQAHASSGLTDGPSRGESALGAILSGDEADNDEEKPEGMPRVRDFEQGSSVSPPVERPRKKEKKKHKKSRSHRAAEGQLNEKTAGVSEHPQGSAKQQKAVDRPHVGFADGTAEAAPETATQNKRPFNIRQLSGRPSRLPSLLSNNVFVTPPSNVPQTHANMDRGAGLRRTASLPDRLNRPSPAFAGPPAPGQVRPVNSEHESQEEEEHGEMSRTCAIVMLLISTGLVAVCADFMSDAIQPLVETTGVSQAFIGLIILPIVGNAAEHVTAVTVAAKNKMDLAIGVAVGSSIQIAIFVTPIIVLLGWIMGKEMSLYFNIFETVSLFVTAFVINFLILDGRSNYLEGSLLIAAYIIIAVASFFYPDGCDASQIGGSTGSC